MTNEEKNERCRKLPLLTTRETKWEGGEKKDGVVHLAYPVYDDTVREWMHKMYELDLTDYNYPENYDDSKSKAISELTRDEVLTRMTFILRKERFSTGAIASALKDGSLEQLSMRLRELTDGKYSGNIN